METLIIPGIKKTNLTDIIVHCFESNNDTEHSYLQADNVLISKINCRLLANESGQIVSTMYNILYFQKVITLKLKLPKLMSLSLVMQQQ